MIRSLLRRLARLLAGRCVNDEEGACARCGRFTIDWPVCAQCDAW